MSMPITQQLEEHGIRLAQQQSRIEMLEQILSGLCSLIGVSPEQFVRSSQPEPEYNKKLQADFAKAANSGYGLVDSRA